MMWVMDEHEVGAMSNHEVGLAVAKKLARFRVALKLSPIISAVEYKHPTRPWVEIQYSNGKMEEFNPCLRWDDVGPIAEKFKIGINWNYMGDPEKTMAGFGLCPVVNKNAKRAICESFLMIDIEED